VEMLGDEAQLYRSLAARLEHTVRNQVHAPREVIEDACHHAWTQLINHGDGVSRDAAFSWLATTALRHAWKLNRREHRELSLEATASKLGELPLPSPLPGPAQRLELREHLRELGDLSERQRRFIWLRAVGLSYVEMAAYTGDTVRTVERQIARASERMRQLEANRLDAEQTPEHSRGSTAPQAGRQRRSIEERGLER
jgi:RNA polymerase sigma factor (sigma-70 family)